MAVTTKDTFRVLKEQLEKLDELITLGKAQLDRSGHTFVTGGGRKTEFDFSTIEATLSTISTNLINLLATDFATDTKLQIISDEVIVGDSLSTAQRQDTINNTIGSSNTILSNIRTQLASFGGKYTTEWTKLIYDEAVKITANTDAGGGPSIASLLGAASTGILATINTTNVANGVVQTAMAASLVTLVASNAAMVVDLAAIEALLITIDADTSNLSTVVTKLGNIEGDIDQIRNDVQDLSNSMLINISEFTVTSIAGGTNVELRLNVPVNQLATDMQIAIHNQTSANDLGIFEEDDNSNEIVRVFRAKGNIAANTWHHEPENDTTKSTEFHGISANIIGGSNLYIEWEGVAVDDILKVAVSGRGRTNGGNWGQISSTGSTATVTRNEIRRAGPI